VQKTGHGIDRCPNEVPNGIAEWTVPERIGTADEVAEAVLFLASGKSSFIGGRGVEIDVGYLIA
jgi:hypothetical protein